ncbi:hypothetical protein ANCCAN_13317 [Ancylostoma caninum]|uniref:Uncharacterized protein n=1 Tax=Ancylostoma caninum TaxID=29170 RepID=A0A368GD58_ANCCA|nr:hypothetical protein ANCCAN_13317 [Ancylostoma caninum]
MKLLLFTIFICASAKKHHHNSEEEESTESKGEKIVDRLAVNLAGAFVKSMFPEVDRAEKKTAEVRRAPVSPLQASLDNYSGHQVSADYNAIPQISQQNPSNPFAYQTQVPNSYSPQSQQLPSSSLALSDGMMQSGLSMPNIPMLMSGGNGSPEALNAIRNQQYLAQLARHQSELTQYSAKQMEYLDHQRRYQQAMLDHQAGAALLMQKQQQDVINEQIKQLKSSYSNSDSLGNDNTVGGRVLTRSHGVKTHDPKAPRKSFSNDDVITNNQHLKEYFKEKYGIELPTDASELTDEERETLRSLKKLLVKNKKSAVENGVFGTMEELKRKVKHNTYSPSSRTSSRMMGNGGCPQCIPHDFEMMEGAWTQMYGNPHVIRRTFGTIASLENALATNGKTTMTSKATACVGLEVGRYSKGTAELNMFYRDDSEGYELHERAFVHGFKLRLQLCHIVGRKHQNSCRFRIS